MGGPRKNNRKESDLDGLRKSHDKRRMETVKVIEKTIIALKENSQSITLEKISSESKRFTRNGQCIAESTILRNQLCRELYQRDAKPLRRSDTPRGVLKRELQRDPSEKEIRRLYYLLRMTKAELIAKIVSLEDSIRVERIANNRLRDEILVEKIGSLT